MSDTPRLLFFDVETSPIKGYTWAVYDANVIKILEPVKILSAAYKFVGDESISVISQCDLAGYRPGVVDDKALCEAIWYILDEADVVIAHNGDSFDIKVLNARFLANGLNPPSDYKTIDTLKVAKRYFKFYNNSLSELGNYLEEGHKAASGGLGTWLGAIEGDPKAWETMKRYNKRDVELLERIYLRLRPYIANHPDLNLFTGGRKEVLSKGQFSCASCQSLNTHKRGFQITKAGRYQRYSCQDCGSWSSGPYERVQRV